MTASKIIERARSLADLQNSKAVSYEDEKNSINEAWRIIYNKLSESDDDFYLTEFEYPDISIYKTSLDYNYVCPLPVDFYKLRTVSYSFNGQWYPMSRLPLNLRNTNMSEPCYRLKNNTLWIVAGTTTNVGAVQITYYPPAAEITLPDYSTTFDVTLPFTSTISNVYCAKNADTLYKCVGNTIVTYTSNKTGTTTIYTGSNPVSNPIYYRGLLYFIENADIYYIDLATSIKTKVNTVTGITCFNIENDIIYYTDNTSTYSNSFIGGTEATLFLNKVYKYLHKITTGSYIYINGANIEINAIVITPATYMVYPFFNYGNDVFKLNDIVPEVYKLNTQIGSVWNERAVALDTLTNSVQTISTVTDTDFTYPTNVLYEILAYQSAADFKRKYEEASVDLEAKLGQLWDSFLHSIIRRDEYKTEKIQNVYNKGINWGNY